MAERLAVLDDRAHQLAEAFWPGPLTLVLPQRADSGLAPAVTAGLPSVALRRPDHPVTDALLRELDLPLAAPSANRSGAISPTSPVHVEASLGDRIPAILDGGNCRNGIESTIVALREGGDWSLLREGPVTRAVLRDILGAGETAGEGIEAPGQLAQHYSPGKPVRLDASQAGEDEFLIGFGEMDCDANLSRTGDLAEAASRLYDVLHQAAASHQPRIAVARIPKQGIGAAITDRLRRAATPA